MSAKVWTEAQQKAIAHEEGGLLVSAAAGSGKTAVLVERAVRLITRPETPVPADRLLILTFTNAAAEELRSRIGVRLEEELHNRPDEVPLRRQRLLLSRSFIGTLDAFCQQLVKEQFAQLELPPDVAVADAALLEQLSQNALDDTMEQMYENPAFARFASLYGRARSDEAAAQAVLALHDFTRTLPYPEQQLQQYAAAYRQQAPLAQTPWGEELLGYAQRALQAARRLCAAALETAAGSPELAPYTQCLRSDEAAIEELETLVRKPDWDAAFALLQSHAFANLRPVRNADETAKNRVQALRKSIKELFTDLQKRCFVCTEQQYRQDLAEAQPMVQALCEASALYEKLFYEAKINEKALDFSDFEQLALGLLQRPDGAPAEVAAQMGRRYEVVMVDEYQDTNELQDALYSCLARPDKSNLFYVGDAKQSIYRFRKANPGLFLDKKLAWAPYESGRTPAVLALGHNFRSSPAVVDGVNFLFTTLMSPALGEIEYNAAERLVAGLPPAEQPPDGPEQTETGAQAGIELAILEDPQGYGDADYVAHRIREMVRQGTPVRDGNGYRRCNYGDFCILLRARTKMPAYLAALENLGIPVRADLAGELLTTPEVLPLIAVLAAADNPGDDVNLAAALVGPLCHFTPDELTRLRAARPKGSLWGALLHSGEAKAKDGVEQIRQLRALAGQLPAGRLCEEIVESTGYLSAVAAMEGGDARRENLQRFIGWANAMSAGGRGTLSSFVRLLQSGKSPAEPAAGSPPGHVALLTIHKSKGLEFPFCILADADHRFNRTDLNDRVQKHARLGVGLWLRRGGTLYPTVPALAVRNRVEQEALSEEMRILYVALTRAKDKAIVCYAAKCPARLLAGRAAELGGGKPDAFLLARSPTLGSWVTSAALCHPDAAPLWQCCGGAAPPPLPAEGHFEMQLLPATEPAQQQQQGYSLTAAPDAALVEELTQAFSAQLPRSALQKVPRKRSVSELAKGDAPPVPARPSFMYKTGLTAAEKGTAQHSFLQYANFEAARRDLQGEISRLVREKFIQPELADALDQAGLHAFLESPLAARMAQAKDLLREYDFITALPAKVLDTTLPPSLGDEPVLVQGIADAVLVFTDGIEIADYKTDHNTAPEKLVQKYQEQLRIYASAVQKRLERPVNKLTIWSFSLSQEVDVPL